MMSKSPPSFAEILRDSSLPPDAAIALELAAPGRHIAAASEIQSVQRGDVPPVRPEFDQINAVVMICHLRYACRLLGTNHAASGIVDKLVRDLEALIERDCPELAKVVKEGAALETSKLFLTAYAIERGQADSERLTWLQGQFFGADTAAGDMVGLPGKWMDLRDAIDRAREEGR